MRWLASNTERTGAWPSVSACRLRNRALLAGLSLPIGLGAMAWNAIGAMPARAADLCDLIETWLPEENGWHTSFLGLESPTIGGRSNRSVCDPLPLSVIGWHFVTLDHECFCEEPNNRWIELATNLDYEWSIVTPGGGYFSPLANGSALASGSATSQQVLWHPPEIEPGETRIFTLRVVATNADDEPTDKPLTVSLTGTFTIECTVREVVEEVDLGQGFVLERMLQRTDYDIQFACIPLKGTGGSEEIRTCEPIHAWEALDPIEADFVAGDPRHPTEELLPNDFVLLSATATDRDTLLLRCAPWLSPCAPSPEVGLDLSDTLTYDWHSSPGVLELQFPAGNSGREVVFSTKGLTGPNVTITVDVRDLGLQSPDQGVVITRTFPIVGSQRTLDSALVATVSSLTLNPTKDQQPPHASPEQAFLATRWADVFYRNSWGFIKYVHHVFKPTPHPTVWCVRGIRQVGGPLFAPHYPWLAAFEIVRHSANPPPERSYANLQALGAWAQEDLSLGGAEHRGVYGLHLEANARRGVLLELDELVSPHFEVLAEHGWTPLTRGAVSGLPLLVFKAFGISANYQRGQQREHRVVMMGECSTEILLRLSLDFQVSETGVRLAKWMTNREPPWIHCIFTTTLNADGSGAAAHSGFPAFPTYDLYVGTGGDELTRVQHKPQESILIFINRGEPVDDNGV